MKRILLCLLILLVVTGCGGKENKGNQNNIKQPVENNQQDLVKQNESKQDDDIIIDDDDEIIDFDDEDNPPIIEDTITVEKVINCDGCVFSYFNYEGDKAKRIGSILSSDEYTTDINNLKTGGGKQRHNFFGLILNGNTISKAYSCILKDNNIYCIQGSVDGTYFTNNIGILNEIFTSNKCKYLSNGHTYYCTDGDYSGDTQTSGYTSLHYETSCTIYGADAKTCQLICH